MHNEFIAAKRTRAALLATASGLGVLACVGLYWLYGVLT